MARGRQKQSKYLALKSLAERWDTSVESILRWADSGSLKLPIYTTPYGKSKVVRRVLIDEVEQEEARWEELRSA